MRTVKNLFDSKSSRIIRVLLSNPNKNWTIRQISQESDVALGYTHAVITTLMKQKYLVRNESYKISLVDPIRLLRRWAASYDYLSQNTLVDFHSFVKEIGIFYDELRNTKLDDYALTGLAGAWLVSPHVRPVTIDMYVRNRKHLENCAGQLGLERTEKGGNVRLVIPYDKGVFYGVQKYGDINVVSTVQLFADLYNYPARGAEASEELLQYITKTWGKALTSDRIV